MRKVIPIYLYHKNFDKELTSFNDPSLFVFQQMDMLYLSLSFVNSTKNQFMLELKIG